MRNALVLAACVVAAIVAWLSMSVTRERWIAATPPDHARPTTDVPIALEHADASAPRTTVAPEPNPTAEPAVASVVVHVDQPRSFEGWYVTARAIATDGTTWRTSVEAFEAVHSDGHHVDATLVVPRSITAFEVIAHGNTGSDAMRRATVAITPSTPETLDVVLKRAAGCVVRLRAVDEHGVALARRAVGLRFTTTGVRPHENGIEIARTDDTGRADIALDHEEGACALRRAILWLADERRTSAAAALPVPGSLVGSLDWGDVSFAEPPLLAAGAVVSADAGHFDVEALVRTSDGSWQPADPLFGGIVDTEEHFELRGFTSAPELGLFLRRAGPALDTRVAPAPPVFVPVGTRDVRLTTVQPGRIDTRVVLDEGIPATSVYLRLHDDRDGYQLLAGTHANGRFELSGIRAGTYALDVLVDSEIVTTVRDVVVTAGAVCSDARISPLDLTGRFGHGVVELVPTTTGEKIVQGTRRVVRADGSRSAEVAFVGSRIEYVAGTGPRVMEIAAEGFAPVRVEVRAQPPSADRVAPVIVPLERAPKRRLWLARPELAPLRRLASLRVRLVPSDSRQREREATFEGPSVELTGLAPGTWRAEWELVPTNDASRPPVSLRSRTITIGDDPRVDVSLELDEIELLDATARLRD